MRTGLITAELSALAFGTALCFAGPLFAVPTNETAQTSTPFVVVNEMTPGAADLRDPFWPVGFVPPSVSRGGGRTRDADSAPDISGLLRVGCVIKKGGKFYATVNGFTVQTGEVVVAVADGAVYRFIVEEIDFKKVKLRPVKK